MTQKPHCIVFDFDGVLIDSNHIKREAYFQVFRHLPGSTSIVEQCLREHAHGDRREVITAIIEKIEPADIRRPALVSQYVEAYAQVCDEQIPRCAEQPGASAMLPLLAAGFPLTSIPRLRVSPSRSTSRSAAGHTTSKACTGDPLPRSRTSRPSHGRNS